MAEQEKLNDILNEVMNSEEETQEVDTFTETETEAETETEERTPVEKETPSSTEKKQYSSSPPKQNRAWAEMRVQNKRYEQALKRIADMQGITVDDLLEKLQNDTDKVLAEQRGISPEIQKQLREQQEELERLKEERNRERFRLGIESLRNEFNLSRDDLFKFLDDAAANGINLLQTSLPLPLVYRALYFDQLVNDAVERARQEFIAREEETSQRAPSNTKRASKPPKSRSDVMTPEQALKQLFDEGALY